MKVTIWDHGRSRKRYSLIRHMTSTPSPGSIALLIQLTRRVYRRANEDVLGMKLKAYMVLGNLRDGALPQADLCASMHMDANNTVLLLNYLEDLGFVERRRDPPTGVATSWPSPIPGSRLWRVLSAPWSRSRKRSSARWAPKTGKRCTACSSAPWRPSRPRSS